MWKLDRLKAVVLLPQCILIPVACLLCQGFGIVGSKTSCVPLLHLNHGMVIVGQTLLGSNGSYPVVDSLPVITQKLIEILHVAVNVWQRTNGVNLAGVRFTKD